MAHISVLSKEVLKGLDIHTTHVVVDCTINGGGHSELIAEKLGESGLLIGIDLDQSALESARERLRDANVRVLLKKGNFRNLDAYLEEESITQADRFLFDLGQSSRQLDQGNRGFSFRFNEPLLMTFKTDVREDDLTAAEIVNEWEEESIHDILRGYGEERYAKRIANAIVTTRKRRPIKTTGDLVSIIERVVPERYKNGRIHPATKTFQALRTTVNDEIESLREGLGKAIERLRPNGRIVVISFHSIEDRLVKRTFKDWEKHGIGTHITKKPIKPSEEEVKENPRSRSAKLRIFEKNGQKEK